MIERGVGELQPNFFGMLQAKASPAAVQTPSDTIGLQAWIGRQRSTAQEAARARLHAATRWGEAWHELRRERNLIDKQRRKHKQ